MPVALLPDRALVTVTGPEAAALLQGVLTCNVETLDDAEARLGALLAPQGATVAWVLAVTLLALSVLGIAGARAGGAPIRPALMRVLVWGSLAMAVTAGIGHLFGISV